MKNKRSASVFGALISLVVFVAMMVLATGGSRAAGSPEENFPAGQVEAVVGGKQVLFPLLKSDLAADVRGDLAEVTVVQTFVNPLTVPVHATYLFPLNKDAAVFDMVMETADEIVRAKIHRTEEARAQFEQAKREGRSASLLIQHRPNMFTQDLCNLMPGGTIQVTLRYVHPVPKVDGAYELVLPLVVGPRYQPLGSGQPPQVADPQDPQGKSYPAGINSKSGYGSWEVENLPAYPHVHGLTIPKSIDPDRVAVRVDLAAGQTISGVDSPTHALKLERTEPTRVSASLADGRTIDNRDFVLGYHLDGDAPQAGLLAYRDERGGFFSLLIEPPREAVEDEVTPREMVFVLDCSGSMRGLPMEAGKRFMRRALEGLRPTDFFRVIRFSESASEFSGVPLPATPENLARGLDYVRGLEGMGGTEMTAGIRQALDAPQPAGTLRLVVFLTDGYIGNEDEILGLIHKKIGKARLFAFGVGASVNRFLLSEMGRVGRGFTRYMDPTENAEEVAVELAGKLQSPVLTDIQVDWGDLKTAEISPEFIPDLFVGGSVRLQGRYENPGRHTITVSGLVRGRRAKLPLTLDFPEKDEGRGGRAIPLVWARTRIQDHMRDLTNGVDEAAKEKVVKLGLDFSLMTRWTSFLAVTEKVVNDRPDSARQTNLPLPMVKGVEASAYGEMPNGQAFAGGSTPEPATTAGLAVMAAAGLAAWRRKRKRT